MTDEPRESLDDDELEEQDGEELPAREAMSIIDPGGAATGNLGPPELADPNV